MEQKDLLKEMAEAQYGEKKDKSLLTKIHTIKWNLSHNVIKMMNGAKYYPVVENTIL